MAHHSAGKHASRHPDAAAAKAGTEIATQPPVWFITGCSTGFGLELAKQALEHGFRTVMTARDPSKLRGYGATDNVLVLPLDVTQPEAVAAAVKAAHARFGAIDVLVNNAGIGYFAAIEEGEEAEVRKMFEVNVFGMSRLIRAVLPGMRQRRQGCVVNVSSVGGLCGFPALGYYNATKFAVEGLSEALWQEIEPLGLHVMVVEPSGFRTDWAGRSANESVHQIDDYMATAGNMRQQLRAVSGKQAGDPVRAAKAIVTAVASGNPPHHLLLGNDAFEGAMAKVEVLRKDFSAGEAVARSADFPTAPPKADAATPSALHSSPAATTTHAARHPPQPAGPAQHAHHVDTPSPPVEPAEVLGRHKNSGQKDHKGAR